MPRINGEEDEDSTAGKEKCSEYDSHSRKAKGPSTPSSLIPQRACQEAQPAEDAQQQGGQWTAIQENQQVAETTVEAVKSTQATSSRKEALLL